MGQRASWSNRGVRSRIVFGVGSAIVGAVGMTVEAGAQSWLDQERLGGDWLGLHGALAERGVDVEAGWTAELARVLDGGARERSTFHHLLDINVTFDLDRLTAIPGATLYADGYVLNGRQLSNDVGDYQGVSNFDSAPMQQLAEVWWEQRLLDDQLRFKLGKVDAYTEFGVVENGGELLHSSVAYSPTTALPSYPDPATAICAFWAAPAGSLLEGASFSLGCFDGAAQEGVRTGARGPRTFFGPPADLYWICEAGWRWSCCGDLAGRCAVGTSLHTGTFDRFDGTTENGTRNGYLTLDQTFWREHPDAAADGQGFGLALRFGLADDEVSEAARDGALALQWTGCVPARDLDVLGFAAAWVEFADDAGFTENEELVLELVYKVQATPWLAIHPDLQYVIHPGGDATLDNAWVAMLRIDVTL